MIVGKFDSLINAANKAINSANALLDSDNVPFNVMYKQYKTIQSFWLRVMDDASESNSKRLEELCIDLEDTMKSCEDWIKENSPNKAQATTEDNTENAD